AALHSRIPACRQTVYWDTPPVWNHEFVRAPELFIPEIIFIQHSGLFRKDLFSYGRFKRAACKYFITADHNVETCYLCQLLMIQAVDDTPQLGPHHCP